jgi:hypothetical protein
MISREIREVVAGRGIYCSETLATEPNAGNYPNLPRCENGEEPNVFTGRYIRTLLPVNCLFEEEQVEESDVLGPNLGAADSALMRA